VRAFNPPVTGLAEPPAGPDGWPPDHELLAAAAGMDADDVSPYRYAPAAAPHLAAQLAGEQIDPAVLVERARAAASEGTLIAEGVGGLLVPLAGAFTVRDLAVALALPVLIAARPGLGTINHTLLTVRAARDAGLAVRAVVLTPWPAEPDQIERSNRDTIAQLGDVEVATLPTLAAPAGVALARAGASLPWRRWLEG
jgi:dethiobiotin synthetase